MDILLGIYLVGFILFCAYFIYVAFTQWDITYTADAEYEMRIAIVLSIIIIGIIWPIAIPYAMFSNQIDKDK